MLVDGIIIPREKERERVNPGSRLIFIHSTGSHLAPTQELGLPPE